jgi:hypothetical protein
MDFSLFWDNLGCGIATVMRTSRNATTAVGFFGAAALCSSLLHASGATIRWHIVTDGSPTTSFILSPTDPTTTNAVSFVAPTDGKVYITTVSRRFLR